MSSGLYSGTSGLALGTGLYKGVSSLWGGASGLVDGFGGEFSPAALFSGGQEGVWYDPSDLTTLWQDYQGVTPVSAAAQPVGLMLDNHIGTRTQVFDDANVTFSGPAGYAGRISPGVYEYARDAGSIGTVNFGGLVSGRSYIVSVQISAYAGSVPGIVSLRADFFDGAVTPRPFVSAAGTYTFYFVATVSGSFTIRSGAPLSGGTISNVSILEVPGNHATQATAAARPTYQTSPDRLTVDKVDDRLVVTVPTGGFVGTMVLATPEGTAAYGVNIPAGSFDIGGVGGLYFPGTAIVGQIIRNGALTTAEINNTIAWLRDKGGGLDYGSVTNFTAFWRGQNRLTSFPLIDTSAGTIFTNAWFGCTGLTSFPALDTSAGTGFGNAWFSCTGLTSFPLIDTSSGTNFTSAWQSCSGLTSFPLIDTSSGTNFTSTWQSCTGLTSFPLIDTSSATTFANAWFSCTGLTSFPLIDTSSATAFNNTWRSCSSLASFPLIDTSSGTNFTSAWNGCTGLTSFPALNFSSATNFSGAWGSCANLTSFPANMFNTTTATNFTTAFTNTALNQTSIDNILVSINTTGTSNGTFNQSGGSAPSATGNTAIDALRARGWTVTVTGGY